MAKELTNLRVTRVDLVDVGANLDRDTGDGSHVMIYKRAEDEDVESIENDNIEAVARLAKAGRKISASRIARLRELAVTLNDFISEAEHIMPNEVMTIDTEKQQEGEISTDVQKAVDAAVVKAQEESAAEITKANDAVAKAIERAEQAEKMALAEVDRRITKAFQEKIENEFKGVPGLTDEDVEVFKSLSAADSEKWERVETILKGAAEAIRTGAMFQEQGSVGSGSTASDAQAEINKRADKLTEGGDLSFGDAIVKVCEDDPTLYARHLEDQTRRARGIQ